MLKKCLLVSNKGQTMNNILLIGQLVADVVVRPVDAFPRDGVCLMTDEVGVLPADARCGVACARISGRSGGRHGS